MNPSHPPPFSRPPSLVIQRNAIQTTITTLKSSKIRNRKIAICNKEFSFQFQALRIKLASCKSAAFFPVKIEARRYQKSLNGIFVSHPAIPVKLYFLLSRQPQRVSTESFLVPKLSHLDMVIAVSREFKHILNTIWCCYVSQPNVNLNCVTTQLGSERPLNASGYFRKNIFSFRYTHVNTSTN